MPTTALLATVILNGVSFSMLLSFLAAGLELMFGVMSIINLAHGSFYMVGAYIGIITVKATGSFLLDVFAGMAVGAFLGVITERFFFSAYQTTCSKCLLLLVLCTFLQRYVNRFGEVIQLESPPLKFSQVL